MSIKLNIKEAKQEVINTVRAYLHKDETGAYEIPPERQRPILLMGPPGIGKTAIMEQVAEELGISLISYTITHHTRQSAIGLPFISRKEYGGEEHAVTEYTMSEIVASVYDRIEASGIAEGILFLDEINCVSETLASRRRWRRPCCSFCSTRCSETTRCPRALSSSQPATRPSTISPCAILTS